MILYVLCPRRPVEAAAGSLALTAAENSPWTAPCATPPAPRSAPVYTAAAGSDPIRRRHRSAPAFGIVRRFVGAPKRAGVSMVTIDLRE